MDINIFISHNSEDKTYAIMAQSYLRQHGINSFLDITDKGPHGYRSVTDWIIANLRKSTHLLVIFSKNTRKSMWVPFELGVGYERNEGIGILLKESIDNLPEYLNEFPVMKSMCSLDYFVKQCKKPARYYVMDSADVGEMKLDPNYARDFINELKTNLR